MLEKEGRQKLQHSGPSQAPPGRRESTLGPAIRIISLFEKGRGIKASAVWSELLPPQRPGVPCSSLSSYCGLPEMSGASRNFLPPILCWGQQQWLTQVIEAYLAAAV